MPNNLFVDGKFLDYMLEQLSTAKSELEKVRPKFDDVCPDGVTLSRVPPIQEAIPVLIDFSAALNAGIEKVRSTNILGPSSRTTRQQRGKKQDSRNENPRKRRSTR